MKATITTYKRWTIVPVTNDNGTVAYYDIHEPCRFRCAQRSVRRADGTVERGKCECWYESEPEMTANTVSEAKEKITANHRTFAILSAFDRFMSGD